jgi:hypothetical protein
MVARDRAVQVARSISVDRGFELVFNPSNCHLALPDKMTLLNDMRQGQ